LDDDEKTINNWIGEGNVAKAKEIVSSKPKQVDFMSAPLSPLSLPFPFPFPLIYSQSNINVSQYYKREIESEGNHAKFPFPLPLLLLLTSPFGS